MDFHGGELFGIEHRVFPDDRVVGEARDVGNGALGNGQRILSAARPRRLDMPAAQQARVAHEAHRNVLDAVVGSGERQKHGRRIEPGKRIVEIDGQVVLRIDFARERKFIGEGILLLGFDPLLAGRLGLAAVAFEFLALLLLLFGLDQPPREFQRFGNLLQDIDRIVLEVGDFTLDRIGQRRRGHVEPQGDGVAPDGLRIDDDAVFGNAVEADAFDARMRSSEVEHRLVLQRPFGLRKQLAAERLVGEHAQIELRLGRDILADRVVPHGEVGHLGRIVALFEEADLIGTGFVHLVVVLVLNGVNPVGDRLEVLGDEDAVVFGTGDYGGLVLEDRRVVFGHVLDRIRREEPDERLRHRVGLVAVGRIARKDHRVDRGTGRKDIAHRIEGVALVVVAHGAAEIERIGRIGFERIAQLDDDAFAAHRNQRLLLHLGRGEELLLLVLELHELVEFDVDLLVVHGGPVDREVVGRHVQNDRRQGVAGTARGGHHARATAQERRGEEQQDCGAQQAQDISFTGLHRYLLLAFSGSLGASLSLTTRQPPSST